MLTSPKPDAGDGPTMNTPTPVRRLRVVALVNNPCVVDARVIREANALAASGHDVHVLAHQANDLPAKERVDGVSYERFAVRRGQISVSEMPKQEKKNAIVESVSGFRRKLRPAIKYIYNFISMILYWIVPRALELAWKILIKYLVKIFTTVFYRVIRSVVTGTGDQLLRHARAYTGPAVALKPDVVHAHDLYTLLAGYQIAQKTGAKLVYDSHELEIGRNGNFSRWELLLRARSERWLIGKADAVITVCDSIADYLVKLYAIERPTVVHNAPSVKVAGKNAHDIRSQLKLSERTPIALYVGSVTINRGLENCVHCLPYAEGVHLVCVGPRHEPTEELLLGEAEQLGVADRLHLVDPVPHDEVTSFVRTSDVSLITIQDVCLSYRFCFPNKLLESLLTGLPVVVSRLVELERIVEKTGAGIVVDQTDPKDIAQGIKQILGAPEKYAPTPKVIKQLKDTYSLEVQMEKLLALYDRLVPAKSVR